jgi:hypothetical protein
MTTDVPRALRERIARDLGPVRPLRSPGRRVLVLLPLGFVLIVLIPAFWGWRANLALLPGGVAWGLSVLQSLAGLAIVGIALREAVPGRELSLKAIVATLAAAALLFLAITFITEIVLPSAERPGVVVRFIWECFYAAARSSIVPLIAAGWLAARAFPSRPGVAGALYGLGAGLMNDAGIRLYCWVDSPRHVILSHGGAILFVTIMGAVVSTLIDRIRSHRVSSSASGEAHRPKSS